MKKALLIITFLSVALMQAQDVAFMSYNIRLDVASDGENAWDKRKEFLTNQVKFYAPDVMGIQEGLPHQVSFIKESLPNYKFIGEGRNGGSIGEHSAIFFNTEKLTNVKQGTFWLSTTPHQPSKGWDAAYPRICTYGKFKVSNSKKVFYVLNTHLDHRGEEARKESVKLILAKIKAINKENLPVVLMGDFNSLPEDEAIKLLTNTMRDSYKEAKLTFGNEGTFNGFKADKIADRRIDYIFTDKKSGLRIEKYATLTDSKALKYPSDHFPVYVLLKMEE
ncbi:endonuclease/exonuclease/phosphatase family protein [Galbibacter mesophilus]|uniref:endonuclease/exonuclease/phosphatase family protein n=1 Tax=Galbibacter mesophilus TaxID=379069 RepID=UPI00191EAEDC|nr:endonuclease/exonuclease/phosphatase family protein [Galbibacter mesophilus]MCM5662297.1 endonuclease/exonuclease/phosphatase family protein [Galbibacter mesophilus]